MLTQLEEYNGLGYAARGVPSPYVWSGTDQYRSGKYVRDGVYDPNAVDSQLGCAGLLMAMMGLDPTISFSGAALAPDTSITPATKPSLTKPANGSIGAWLASILSAIFKSKGK
jgi:lysozyme family protein